MSDSTGQPNKYRPGQYVADYVSNVHGINEVSHLAWEVRHEPDGLAACYVVLQVEHRNPRTYTERRNTADRIAACLNSCDGINPEAVPELVRALHLIADAHADNGMTYCQYVARAALALAKGGVA